MNKGSAKLSRFFFFSSFCLLTNPILFFLFGQLSLVIEQSPSLSFVDSHRWVEKLRKETNETMKVNSQLVIRLCEPYNEIRVMVWRNRGEIREMNRFLVLARFLIFSVLLSFRVLEIARKRAVWYHWWNIHRDFSHFLSTNRTDFMIWI